ncbi:hypothetical protein PIB30_101634, partial [Stylosanthes scabra]|nr:hypothetical protein [Stylosanthes scabra]
MKRLSYPRKKGRCWGTGRGHGSGTVTPTKESQRTSIEGATTSKMIEDQLPLLCESEKEEVCTDGGDGKQVDRLLDEVVEEGIGGTNGGSGRITEIGDHLPEIGCRRSFDGAAP